MCLIYLQSDGRLDSSALLAKAKTLLREYGLQIRKVNTIPMDGASLFEWLSWYFRRTIEIIDYKANGSRLAIHTFPYWEAAQKRPYVLYRKGGLFSAKTPRKMDTRRCRRCGDEVSHQKQHMLFCALWRAGGNKGTHILPTQYTFNSPKPKFRRQLGIVERLRSVGVTVTVEDFLLQDNLSVYDTESLSSPIQKNWGGLSHSVDFVNSQETCCIALAAKVCGNEEIVVRVYWLDECNGDPGEMVEQFVRGLMDLSRANSEYMQEKYIKYFQAIDRLWHGNSGNPFRQRSIHAARQALSRYCDQFLVIGYNSAKYDLQMLIRCGLYGSLANESGAPPKVLKKNQQYLR